MKKMNIILIVADDHGRDGVGCYGNQMIKTPCIDGLAGEGVKFTNAFCTSASCAASRSVILTGIYNHANGTFGHTHAPHHFSLLESIRTLPDYLNQAGYVTARTGKKHYSPESKFPFLVDIKEPEHCRDDVQRSENCRDFIENTSEPFFLYWCSNNPHRDGRFILHDQYKIDRFGNPDGSFDNDEEEKYSESQVKIPYFLNDDMPTRLEMCQYYQSISRLDRGVGQLLKILRSSGKYDNTLIIYISDNGSAFPCSKTTLYEPGMCLPCIVKSPFNQSKNAECDALITWADITPTILDFASAQVEPEQFHGKSFKEIIGDDSPENWRNEIYASHSFHQISNYYPMRAIRTKRYKFIWNIAYPLTYSFANDLWHSAAWQFALAEKNNFFGSRTTENFLHHPKFELYDLINDPEEVNNLADKPEYMSLADKFCVMLKEFQLETQDPWLHKWDYE